MPISWGGARGVNGAAVLWQSHGSRLGIFLRGVFGVVTWVAMLQRVANGRTSPAGRAPSRRAGLGCGANAAGQPPSS